MKRFFPALLAASLAAVMITPAPAAKPLPEPLITPELSNIATFEVETFPNWDFGLQEGRIDPEVLEFARRSLLKQDSLRAASPGQGILHFYCEGDFCNRVRAEVTLGADGPVVWRVHEDYRKDWFRTYKNSQGLAERVVKRLAEDYQRTLSEQQAPVKIDIKPEQPEAAAAP